jgi:hypothetical protein
MDGVLFWVRKAAMLPVPDAGILVPDWPGPPTVVFLQRMMVPTVQFETNENPPVKTPLQKAVSRVGLITGDGTDLMMNFITGPAQLSFNHGDLKYGVTTMVSVSMRHEGGGLTMVTAGKFPLPDEGRPGTVVPPGPGFFTQLKDMESVQEPLNAGIRQT